MGDKKSNGKVVKWLIVPTLLASFIGVFIFPQIRLALTLYLFMGLWSLNIYRQRTYQQEVYGIKKGVFKKIFIGVGIGITFLIISAISPSFSLLTPTLSLSVSEDIRWVIIVILAPIAEEVWRSATKGFLHDIYKAKFWKLNTIQAFIFALLHTLVYGVAFESYSTWIQVYGAYTAIIGSLLAAFVFGLISGYMMEKFKDVIPSIAAHQVINYWLLTKGLVIVVSILPLIMIK